MNSNGALILVLGFVLFSFVGMKNERGSEHIAKMNASFVGAVMALGTIFVLPFLIILEILFKILKKAFK